MMIRLIGAVLVITASTAMGFGVAAAHKKETLALQHLIRALEFMSWELEYRMPPLSELCRLTALQVTGPVRMLFMNLERELQMQIAADATCCMAVAIDKTDKLPAIVIQNLLLLGKTLGRFDLSGQLSGIASVCQLCCRDLEGLQNNQQLRLRSYRTLGICAGIALVILFI